MRDGFSSSYNYLSKLFRDKQLNALLASVCLAQQTSAEGPLGTFFVLFWSGLLGLFCFLNAVDVKFRISKQKINDCLKCTGQINWIETKLNGLLSSWKVVPHLSIFLEPQEKRYSSNTDLFSFLNTLQNKINRHKSFSLVVITTKHSIDCTSYKGCVQGTAKLQNLQRLWEL